MIDHHLPPLTFSWIDIRSMETILLVPGALQCGETNDYWLPLNGSASILCSPIPLHFVEFVGDCDGLEIRQN